jgi:small conductance mechanosensitive channel
MNNFLTAWGAFWAIWQTPIRIALIVLVALVARGLLLLSVKRVIRTIIAGANGTNLPTAGLVANARVVQRSQTLGSVLSNFITWGIALVAISSILSELGVAVGALIAGAGIIGAALGFGAQSLVRDIITGIFIVFEDQYGVGDTVDLGEASGVVESVGLRVTKVRDAAGCIWYVRNGEIVRVGNQSQGWSRVVLDIPLAYESAIDDARNLILSTAKQLMSEPDFAARQLAEPEVWGIELLTGDQVVVRLVQKVGPSDSDTVARELRSRIKSALDPAGVKLASTKTPIHLEVSGRTIG